MKHYGLPLWLLHVMFLAALFELLRRLFRNVGRGDSFSPGTIRLVQAVAGSDRVFVRPGVRAGPVWSGRVQLFGCSMP